jgi:hypothetical protein
MFRLTRMPFERLFSVRLESFDQQQIEDSRKLLTFFSSASVASLPTPKVYDPASASFSIMRIYARLTL